MISREKGGLRKSRMTSAFRQRGANGVFWHVAADESLSDSACEDEAHAAGLRFLVMAHVAQHLVGWRPWTRNLADPGRQTGSAEMAFDAAHDIVRDKTEPRRKPERQHTAQRHAFPMDQAIRVKRR